MANIANKYEIRKYIAIIKRKVVYDVLLFENYCCLWQC